MKKMSMIFLAALCLLWPMTGAAQGLPAFLDAVQEGLTTGLAAGTAQAVSAMDQELTLDIAVESGKIEEGKSQTITLTAGNPRPVETHVTMTLKLPERLAPAQETTWEAVLPPAQADEQTGVLTPSVTTFTREVTLTPGQESEQVTLECEMNMGTRFYRASVPLELCVADISAVATATGAEDGRMAPGESLTYEVEICNAGTAPKDVEVEFTLPEGMKLTGSVQGFTHVGKKLTGRIRAEAAVPDEAGLASSSTVIRFPVRIGADVLEGDEDATRLLSGQLRVDGERVSLPRIQVCGPKITARLLPEADQLKQGEEMALRVVVVNAGLAAADVQISCVLPEGLSLVTQKEEPTEKEEENEQEAQRQEATPAQALPGGGDDGSALDAAAVLTPEAEEAMQALSLQQDGTLIFDMHMDAAQEEDGNVMVNTRVLDLRVRADVPQENIREKMLGATLAWTTDGGQTQLGEAVALRVYSPMFLGLTGDEWSGIFWAGLLLVITVACLYAAVCADSQKDDYVCD